MLLDELLLSKGVKQKCLSSIIGVSEVTFSNQVNFYWRFIFLITIVFLSSSFTLEPDLNWIRIGKSSGYEWFFRSKYISKNGSKISIWMKVVYEKPKEKNGKKIVYELILEKCDCNIFASRSTEAIEYTENGEVIKTFSFNDRELKYAPPESVQYKYVSEICSYFGKNKNN